jgi:effector-binding domain-containing protein
VPRELVATLAVGPDGDDSAAFYRLEAVVRGLGLRANRPPAMLVHPPGPDGPLPDEVAVPVTARFASQGGIEVRELPACRVAAAVHRGPYAGLPDAQAALERWVAAAGFPVTGRLRILYLQFGAEPELRVPTAYLVERAEDFVTELQLELD